MHFAPFEALAADLLPLLPTTSDGAHDGAHLARVWVNAWKIAAIEGGADEDLAAAVLLHDCVAVEKSSPLRAQASRLAAEHASVILAERGWAAARIATVAQAIVTHSFSAGIAPTSLIGRILQDADRLDAIGGIGIARCFYTAGRMGSKLYHPDDPRAEGRKLDDAAYAIDHFRAKLLKLGDGFQTATGAAMANARTKALAAFLENFELEIGATMG